MDKKEEKKEDKPVLPEEELVSKSQFNQQTEEDQELKDKLELCVERLGDSQAQLRKTSLDMIK